MSEKDVKKDKKVPEMRGRITLDEYMWMSQMGKELHDYWWKHKKKMYKELADSGQLLKILKSEDERLDELVLSLIHENGLQVQQAVEIARAQIFDEMYYDGT